MGGVELLSREGEIAIAKRIEAGKDVMLIALSLIHISEPTRQAEISYAVFCLKKKKKHTNNDKKRKQHKQTCNRTSM